MLVITFVLIVVLLLGPPPTALAILLDAPLMMVQRGAQSDYSRPPFSAPIIITQSPSSHHEPLMKGIISFLIVDSPSVPQPSGSSAVWKDDKVVRVLDANTIKLDRTGLVSLAAVKTPLPGSSSFEFSECLNRSPSYKLKQLLAADEKVRIQTMATSSGSSSSNHPQAVVVRVKDGMVVNEELVRSGFARVRKNNLFPNVLSTTDLMAMENQARDKGMGLFKRCSDDDGLVVEAQFEPLDLTTETQWGVDGGKTVLRSREQIASSPPVNPGDRVGCSDFPYYEDALKYYERYYSYYGDVAKLDRNGDGIPCPGLPHTPVAERYRMKVSKTSTSQRSHSQ